MKNEGGKIVSVEVVPMHPDPKTYWSAGDPYLNWKKRLAGEEVPTYETEPDFGFYRRPLKQDRKIVGWEPVAFFADELGDRALCLLGDVLLEDANAISQVWLWSVANPITEEQYRQAADHGVWFDADPVVMAARETNVSAAEIDVVSALTKQIAEAKRGVAAYAKIEDDDTASKAQDLRSHLTTLAGKLDKERKELVQPHLDAQREINGRLTPIVDSAKEAAAAIKKSQEAWELIKRQSSSSNIPPPRSQIRGSTGRAAAVKEAFDAVLTDIVAYFQTVKDNPEVVELLQKLAQRDIDAGLRPAGVEARPTVRVR